MKQLIVRNFWLKLMALLLAIIVWLYVVGELNKGTPEEKAFFKKVLPLEKAGQETGVEK